jgi:hypothetical protein
MCMDNGEFRDRLLADDRAREQAERLARAFAVADAEG